MCDLADHLINSNTDLSSVSIPKCSSVLNGVLTQGISKSYSYMLSEFREFQIEYDAVNKTQKNIDIIIGDPRYLADSTAITIYLNTVLQDLEGDLSNAFEKYFMNMM